MVGQCPPGQNTVSFTVSNNGGPLAGDFRVTVTNAQGQEVFTEDYSQSTALPLTVNIGQQAPGEYDIEVFYMPQETSSSFTVECLSPTATPTFTPTPTSVPPSLDANGLCAPDGTLTFTVSNSAGPLADKFRVVVTGPQGNQVFNREYPANTSLPLVENIGKQANGQYTVTITYLGDNSSSTFTVVCSSGDEPTPTPPSPAGQSGANICIQTLVFHTFRDDNLEIYRLDGIEGQPGFELYNLSRSTSVDSRPSRSPNDIWVAFQSNRNGNVELYYTALDGSGDPVRLTNTQSNNTTPMYGPDERTIVFQSDRNGNLDLFTIDQVSGEQRQITSNPADDINGFYSPDLRWLVFQSNRNNNWDVFILDTVTGNEFQLTDSPANETFPAWSPNGKQVAFISDVDGGTDLFIIDVTGENLKRITTDGKTVNAVWSPEGNRIAYQSERNGNLDIYSYDLLEDEEYRVTDYEGIDAGPTWDCGGTNLAFTSLRDDDANIFQVFWQGGSAGNMTIDPATDKWSQWRPSNDVSSTGY